MRQGFVNNKEDLKKLKIKFPDYDIPKIYQDEVDSRIKSIDDFNNNMNKGIPWGKISIGAVVIILVIWIIYRQLNAPVNSALNNVNTPVDSVLNNVNTDDNNSLEFRNELY